MAKNSAAFRPRLSRFGIATLIYLCRLATHLGPGSYVPLDCLCRLCTIATADYSAGLAAAVAGRSFLALQDPLHELGWVVRQVAITASEWLNLLGQLRCGGWSVSGSGGSLASSSTVLLRF